MVLTIAIELNVEYNIYCHYPFLLVSGHACAAYGKHMEVRRQLLDSEDHTTGPGIDFYRCLS